MTVITASPTQFGKLLDLQRGLLDQSITQTIHADVNGQVLRNIREITHAQLTGQKDLIESTKEQAELKKQSQIEEKQLKQTEETNSNIVKLATEIKKKAAEDAKIIASIAGNSTTFKTLGEKIGDIKGGLMSKFGSLNALKRTALSATNVGGIFNKSIAKMDYVKEQQMLGDKRSTSDISADFAKQQSAAKAIKANESKIDAYKKMGLSENQIAKTEEGKKLLANRESLSKEYAKYDIKSTLSDNEDTNNVSEEEMEAARAQTEQTDLLRQLVNNTGGEKPKVEAPSEGKSGGMLDGIMGMFSGGFMSAISKLFNPAMMLKVITKVFAPLAIIGGVVNGIMDGFKEFSESGDIGEALIAGLGGFLDFLTFGLINKDTLKNVYQSLKESMDALFGSIGIPEIKFKIPVINKEVTIPEFYPFRMDKKPAPAAPEPTAAASVEQKSAENAEAALENKSGGNQTSVVAPTTNIKNSTSQVVKLPVRNQDQTMNRYVQSKYA